MEQAWRAIDRDLCISGASAPTRGLVTMLMGKIGTWKTTTASMWPRPLFFSISKEGGDKALGQLPKIWGTAPPPFYVINCIEAFNAKLEFVINNWQRMGIATLVIDSATTLFDMWVSELLELRTAELAMSRRRNITEIDRYQAIMEQSDWGRLENYAMRRVAEKLHATGLNIVWITLLKEKYETSKDGPYRGQSRLVELRPDLQGATARKLPAMADLLLYARKEQRPTQGGMANAIVYYTETPPGDPMMELRHRFGPSFPNGRLIDPEFGDWIPTFRAIQQQIGQYIRY